MPAGEWCGELIIELIIHHFTVLLARPLGFSQQEREVVIQQSIYL